MAPTADPQPSSPAPTVPATAPATVPRKWAKLTDNPLLTVLGTAAVALLVLTLTRTDNRISRLEDKMDAGFAAVDAKFAAQDAKIDAKFAAQDAKFAAVEDKMGAGFAAVDAKFAAQDAKIDDMSMKLTALIAALNATEEVGAALEGRLLDSAPTDAGPVASAGSGEHG